MARNKLSTCVECYLSNSTKQEFFANNLCEMFDINDLFKWHT